MSGRGKGGKTKGKAKTRSSRADLQFPVGRIHRLLRKGNYAERVHHCVHRVHLLYTITRLHISHIRVFEYTCHIHDYTCTRVTYIHGSNRKLWSGVTIAQGGVLPNIKAVLLPKKTGTSGSGKGDKASQEY
ncbi:PREDICTED: histone H2A-like [Vollenhovia emeryi]|uniref:histone H2A-like n=1 Tax=Vollenhovia emeryi TaxID=411798 RepID=UPI0005F42D54|nr:PREDICTED: histone H2A-like [Vollenhovia emeryi]